MDIDSKKGVAEQSYIIQLMGEAETVRIVVDGKTPLAELCPYRDALCLLKQADNGGMSL